MNYIKDYNRDSNYVSVNTLIQPKKHRENASLPNAAVERGMQAPAAGSPPLVMTPPDTLPSPDSSIRISQPNDPGEIEADRIASEITGATTPARQSSGNTIQAN